MSRPSWLILQIPDIGEDGVDLRIVEAAPERRHAGRLALLDLVDDVFVRLVGTGELGAAALGAAAALMTPAARRREQLSDVQARRLLAGFRARGAGGDRGGETAGDQCRAHEY